MEGAEGSPGVVGSPGPPRPLGPAAIPRSSPGCAIVRGHAVDGGRWTRAARLTYLRGMGRGKRRVATSRSGPAPKAPIEPELITLRDGTREWRLNGKLHREGGPAVERADGARAWWLNGDLHREDGPAVERRNGTREW